MPDDFVTVAQIRRPQGRHGEVIAALLTDFPKRFRDGGRYWLLGAQGGRREVDLERAWLHKGAVVLKFAGVDTIEAAETLRDCEVQIPRSERVAISGGAVYVSDLMGCRVVEKGVELGRVAGFDDRVGTPLLVVETSAGELLIPFAAEICRRVDAAAGVIEVDLPEGLKDLDARSAGGDR